MRNHRQLFLTLGVTALAATLTGCTTQEIPSPNPSPESAVLATSPQKLNEILSSVNEVITEADKNQDAKLLTKRVNGAALSMRKGQYELHKADSKIAIPQFPGGSEATTVSLAKGWPKVILNVTKSDSKNQKYIEIYTQDSAKSGFKLSQWMRLLPGATFPPTSVPGKGSELLKTAVAGTLKTSPDKAVADWASTITDPKNTNNRLFVKSDFTKGLQDEYASLKSAIGNDGKLSVEIKPSKDVHSVLAISLPDGGALVTATYTYNLSVTNVKSRKPLVFSGTLAKLLGDGGKVTSKASWTKTITVLFMVPKSDSKEQILVIGAENVITKTAK